MQKKQGWPRSIFQPKALPCYGDGKNDDRLGRRPNGTATIVDKSHLYSEAASSLLSSCALMVWSVCMGKSSSRRSLFISSFQPRLLSSRAHDDLSSLFIRYSAADRLSCTRPTIGMSVRADWSRI